jgi:hypothetical protein
MTGMDARAVLERSIVEAHDRFVENVRDISIEQALDAAGGYRSILGIAKHVAAWSAVYHSYAFETEPRHWDATDWPRGLRDRIDPSQGYLDEVLAWFERTFGRWGRSLRELPDPAEPRSVHWGDRMPLADIIVAVGQHWMYHAGEINAIRAIQRGEAWEYTEEVEENHISTAGHRVRPEWMSDEDASEVEER